MRLETVNVITTASLPWRTGTAILALLRAHYLAERGLDVRLYIPWIPVKQQALLFGETGTFDSFEAQEHCIRSHLPKASSSSLQIEFYPATYKAKLGSILPTCSLDRRVRFCDWLLLEEPEHLNWKHPWSSFGKRATRVTGIVLTNYHYYMNQAMPDKPLLPWLMDQYNRWLIQHHCDDIIRPSSAIPHYLNSQVFHLNGIHPSFFETPLVNPDLNRIYFMGKLIWDKGFRELINLLSVSEIREIDVYGEGKDKAAIDALARSRGIQLQFKGNSVTPPEDLQGYKIFINVSRSEIICTTTAEALGQGRFVILPTNPGNNGYYKFKNCLVYASPQEFNDQLKYALENSPIQDAQVKSLTWEAATDRLLQYYQKVVTCGYIPS